MKKQFGNTLVVMLIAVSVLFISCLGYNERGVEADAVFKQPAYHLMPFRAEFAMLFYETPERVGFSLMDGIFLYNYQEDSMEAEFALSEGCFEPGYVIIPRMSTDEQSIIIGGMDKAEGIWSDHYLPL